MQSFNIVVYYYHFHKKSRKCPKFTSSRPPSPLNALEKFYSNFFCLQAAKYYNEAAKNGHPDAMYNLGVFHAQGRGGLEPDVDKARELFTEAASLGQAQAQIALDLETNVVSSKNDDVASECVQSGSFGLSDKLRNRRKGMTLLEMAGYQNSVNEDTRHESSRDSDAYCNESMREFLNPTDMFLHTLGIQTNPVPILVGSDDSNSPYYH